jgi:ElaB/YqjD/DUF883 family membrane-anchored ribosome-binding protein
MKGAAMDNLKKDISDLRRDIARFTRNLAPNNKSRLERWRDDIGDTADDVYGNVKDYSQRAYRTGWDTVKNNPVTSAVWGAAIGLLIYKLFDRR